MLDRTTSSGAMEAFVQTMTDGMTTLARWLAAWGTSEPHTLQDLEEHVLHTIKDLVNALLIGLAQLSVPADLVRTMPCACGSDARLVCMRAATVKTVLGPITLQRPYYHCAACHHGTLLLKSFILLLRLFGKNPRRFGA